MMEQNVQRRDATPGHRPLLIGSPAPPFVTRTTMGNRNSSLSLGIPATIVFTIAMIAGVFVHDYLFKVRRDDQVLL